MNTKPIYLDYDATSPIDRRVAKTMTPFLYEHFENLSSAHPFGKKARQEANQAAAIVSAAVKRL